MEDPGARLLHAFLAIFSTLLVARGTTAGITLRFWASVVTLTLPIGAYRTDACAAKSAIYRGDELIAFAHHRYAQQGFVARHLSG